MSSRLAAVALQQGDASSLAEDAEWRMDRLLHTVRKSNQSGTKRSSSKKRRGGGSGGRDANTSLSSYARGRHAVGSLRGSASLDLSSANASAGGLFGRAGHARSPDRAARLRVAKLQETYQRSFTGIEACNKDGISVLDTLIESSLEASEHARPNTLGIRNGAALMTTDGTVFTGCNVESNTNGLCVSAERTAILKAVSEGKTEFLVRGMDGAGGRGGREITWGVGGGGSEEEEERRRRSRGGGHTWVAFE
jgi:hypothetical protein